MKWTRYLRSWEFALFALLLLELGVLGLVNPVFFNLENLLYSTLDFTHILFAALPLTLVIITAGIDISGVSVMGLASITLGLVWVAGVNVFAALAVALLVGVLAGAFNGFFVSRTDVNPLVITLGTLFMFAGLAQGMPALLDKLGFKAYGSAGLAAYQYEGITGLPDAFIALTEGSLGIVPYPFLAVLFFAFVLSLLLHKTRFGRYLYLIGVNPKAATYSGVPIRRVLVWAYVLSGFGAALAGVMLTSYFTSARADLGGDALLPIITAVVLGGADILGGSGTILGTLLAGMILGFLRQGLLALGVTNDLIQVVVGSLLILAMAAKQLLHVYGEYRLKRKALSSRDGR
ncbi:monosaccharide ABC transporter membrane protein, CUT2 family [Oceanithermus profundus DSM 14977]|uniref:Autoinducer 2 import system permease protein LsrD n=1 Tax=Oceanithermus profundus (strain DSM 14977 / NBRC 100410 / VKM B-2274 / 506) TaxID=670487 RepID=E4U7P5_OCEP5|nr:ABC transporter permease [Oceanithermus profundus]ADR36494.1 monosaccharide ABC transporter membrane protein, CUT2 family [Oceanithermus profundus DSM 14977]